jgi:hypothetical protein
MQIYWLIELPQNCRSGSPLYFGWEEGSPNWTGEVNDAFCFDNKQEAETYANEIGLLDWEVLEHAWIDRHEPAHPHACRPC